MFRQLVLWLHLGLMAALIVGLSVGQFLLRFVYRIMPFTGLLDRIYMRLPSGSVPKRWFAYRLGDDPERSTAKTARLQQSAREMVLSQGFRFEEHAVTTEDGYILGVHRIIVSDGDSADEASDRDDSDEEAAGVGVARRPAASLASGAGGRGMAGSIRSSVRRAAVLQARRSLRNRGRPPVLLQHGLMQCSEAWLVGGKRHALPYLLAEAGFDVWLANTRGNKYSQKHVALAPDSDAFWNFSLDQFARYDMPATIDHVLEHTGARRVGYVGFSQGTALAFASLSLRASLNDKLSCFVALSPAVSVRRLAKSPVTALVQADLRFFQLLFGRRRMLPVTLELQRMLSGRAWSDFIDGAWQGDTLDELPLPCIGVLCCASS